MAKIELSVATWVATVEATDDEAVIAILEAYERAYPNDLNPAGEDGEPLPLPPPEVRLQNMLEHLVKHVEAVAQGQLRREALAAAAAASDADPIQF